MTREEIYTPKIYYSIIDGTFRQKVPKEHPDAVAREWESSDGKTKGTKYERVINTLICKIEGIEFHEGDYGMNVEVILDENADGINPVLSISVGSKEGEDFLKKIPNVDLTKEVKLRPFNFEGEKGEKVRGLEIIQFTESGEPIKIKNFFRDEEAKKNINGLPSPEKENIDMTKTDWKIYFLQVNAFLVKYTQDSIVPKFFGKPSVQRNHMNTGEVYPEDNINVEDIPF